MNLIPPCVLYLWTYACFPCVCMPVWVCVCGGGLRLMPRTILDCSSTLSRVSQANLDLVDTASLTSQLALGIPSLPFKAGIPDRLPHPPSINVDLGSKVLSSLLWGKHANRWAISLHMWQRWRGNLKYRSSSERGHWKSYVPWSSNAVTFWKRDTIGEGEQIMCWHGLGKGGATNWNTEDNETAPYMACTML